jgi:radical SAM/Cys-rich protein
MKPFLSHSDPKPVPPGMPAFSESVRRALGKPLYARGIQVLQANLGYRCNLQCGHCHVSAGPLRRESMDGGTVKALLRLLRVYPIPALDITGGAPELHPHFRMLVREARKAGKRVIVRTNLAVLFEPGNEDLPEFFRDHQVELIASLPCYLEGNVDRARGRGTYGKSIEALRLLNSMGYGKDEEPALLLSLVYNPGGPFLPPPQAALEADYLRELRSRFGISFNRLYAFTNMPVGRFRAALLQRGELGSYQALLASSFNPAAVERVMCTSMLSVGWDGTLCDCDFNQAMAMPVIPEGHRHITSFDHAVLSNREISLGDHCYGCTAGQGSS